MSKSQNDHTVTHEQWLEIELNSLVESHLIELINSLIEENSTLKSNSKHGRKQEVLDILIKYQPISILSISKKLDISTKNVSSLLSYLRSDNINICTNSNGLKFIYQD